MDLIEHTYTIQWVGPMDYEEYREYLRNQEKENITVMLSDVRKFCILLWS